MARKDKEYQSEAFEEILTIGWWYRQQYNLAPTDPRYLQATTDIMWLDYWCHELRARWERVSKSGITPKTLEQLLEPDERGFVEEMTDAEFNRQLAILEREDILDDLRREAGIAPPDEDLHGEALARPSPVITFRAPRHG